MDDPRFPLSYQIICIILTALVVWAFAVARQPRQWRRLYQALFSRADRFSVNRNKVLDEKISRYGIILVAILFAIDAAFFVAGMTHKAGKRTRAFPVEHWTPPETKPFNGTLPSQ